MLGCAVLCDAMLCYGMLCDAMLCCAMVCYAMRCYAVLWYAMRCDAVPYCGKILYLLTGSKCLARLKGCEVGRLGAGVWSAWTRVWGAWARVWSDGVNQPWQENTTVTTLELPYNPFGPDGCKALAEAVKFGTKASASRVFLGGVSGRCFSARVFPDGASERCFSGVSVELATHVKVPLSPKS